MTTALLVSVRCVLQNSDLPSTLEMDLEHCDHASSKPFPHPTRLLGCRVSSLCSSVELWHPHLVPSTRNSPNHSECDIVHGHPTAGGGADWRVHRVNRWSVQTNSQERQSAQHIVTVPCASCETPMGMLGGTWQTQVDTPAEPLLGEKSDVPAWLLLMTQNPGSFCARENTVFLGFTLGFSLI